MVVWVLEVKFIIEANIVRTCRKARLFCLLKIRGFIKMEKKGIVQDYIVWIVIGLAFLALMTIAIFLLKGKGFNLIEQDRKSVV